MKQIVKLVAKLTCCGVIFLSTVANAEVSCDIRTSDGVLVDFGTYQKLSSTPNRNTGTIELVCTRSELTDPLTISATITIGPGVSNSFATRHMRQGGASADYNLYASPSYVPANVVGDGSLSGPQTLSVSLCPTTGTGGPTCTAIVYGDVPAAQNIPAGEYVDTVTITATF